MNHRLKDFILSIFNLTPLQRWLLITHRIVAPHSSLITYLSSLLLLLSSCTQKLNLPEGDMLLYGQSVKGAKQITVDELEGVLPQKPNRKLLRTPLMPYLGIYRLGLNFYDKRVFENQLTKIREKYSLDSTKVGLNLVALQKLTDKKDRKLTKYQRKIDEGNTIMRMGEAPAVISEREIQKNTERLTGYLRDKGFFRAIATYKMDTLFGDRVNITYTVQEGKPYHIQGDSLFTTNTLIDSLLREGSRESFLKKGTRHERTNFENEKIRIEQLLLDKGFFGFNREYVKFKADTTGRDSTQKDKGWERYLLQINNPPKGRQHEQYRLSDVEFVMDGLPDEGLETGFDTVRKNGVNYYFRGRKYATNLLDAKVLLRPYQLYKESNKTETQRQLATLDQFKFAEVTFRPDTSQRSLRTRIYSVPLEKYQFTGEGGVNVFQGYPGPFGNLTLKVRSILGGLESLEISARAGIEGQTGFLNNNQFYTGKELGLNASLVFPQILLPRKIASKFDRYNPRTQLGGGLNFTDRPEYQRTNFKLAMNYSWQKGQKQLFNASLFDVNLIRTNFKSSDFQKYLEDLQINKGNNLIQSFRKSFVSSISGSYAFNENVIGQNRKARYLRVFAETGGTTLNLISNGRFRFIDRLFSGGDDSLKFYQFLRLNTDFRYYLPLGKQSKLALRVNAGFAHAYGQSQDLPYEKYFFVGGSNSLRAWLPRRVGQGIIREDVLANGRIDYTFEKQGNVMFEASAELRFPMLKLGGDINGAIFVDAGNVWLTNTNDNEASRFYIDRFLGQLAIGTGFGLRYDFTYFVIRTDFGIKVVEPARPAGERYVLPNFSLRAGSTNPLVFNVGIGYPF